MLQHVQSSTVATGYIFTADDERILEFDFAQEPWELIWTVRGLDGKVLRQWRESTSGGDGSWTWQKDYVYRDGMLLAAEMADEDTHHFHLDHLGSPRLITDGDGHEVSRHTYFPFGEGSSSTCV